MSSLACIGLLFLVQLACAGWLATAEDELKVAGFDETALSNRFVRACTERCLQRLKTSDKCSSFCGFIPTLIADHYEDLQRLPLSAQEMVSLSFDPPSSPLAVTFVGFLNYSDSF